jgi:hypothetical protein
VDVSRLVAEHIPRASFGAGAWEVAGVVALLALRAAAAEGGGGGGGDLSRDASRDFADRLMRLCVDAFGPYGFHRLE